MYVLWLTLFMMSSSLSRVLLFATVARELSYIVTTKLADLISLSTPERSVLVTLTSHHTTVYDSTCMTGTNSWPAGHLQLQDDSCNSHFNIND